MVSQQALVVFTPSGRRGRFPVGTSVLQAARALGVDIDAACGGRGLCGCCQSVLSEGEFAKHGVHSRAGNLSARGENELAWEKTHGALPAGRRLSCSTTVLGDVVIDVPAGSQVHRQLVRKDAQERDIALDPAIRLHYVEVRPPDLQVPSSDLRRLKEALDFDWGLTKLQADLRVVQELQSALRRGQWKVTVAVADSRHIIAVWPGRRDKAHGMAVDVGSTTIAAHLCELQTGAVVASAGRMNPQIRFGEDLMSRVSYVMMNPGGDAELTREVRAALDELAADLAREAGIRSVDILEATFVGNPIMHHLLFGISPVELGGAPFALATDEALSGVRASEIDLHLHPGARIYALPCIAGHVGADTAAAILSEAPHLTDAMTLVVDIGTNAEIVLGNRDRLLAASSPTGPAFEGAQISCGQRAAPGAIERVRIDPVTLEPRFRVLGCASWSDEPGFAEATAAVGITGICGSGIVEVIAEMYLAGIIDRDGSFDGTLAARSRRVQPDGRTFAYLLYQGEARTLRVTQNDVRAIQLAKAALYAGTRLLMDKLGVAHVERIRLAGAFGSHIDAKYAMILGLLPDCPLDHVAAVGNAAGTGARIALLNRARREEIESVVRRVEKIETAVEGSFQQYFVDAMAIPHKSDPFSELRAAVHLPEGRSPRKRPREPPLARLHCR